MNIPVPDLETWSRARYWTAFAIALVAQALLIYALSERQPAAPRAVESTPVHYLVLDSLVDTATSEWLQLGDPTLFALPNLRGFSGAAWLRPNALNYQPTDWVGPDCWLTPDLTEPAAPFTETVDRNTAVCPAFVDKPAPRLSEVNPRSIPLPTKSSVRVEGELARRALLGPVEVPSLPHTDILTNTVVELGVNPSGLVQWTVVLGSSGS